MSPGKTTISSIFFLLTAILLVGCDRGPAMGSVSGTVTLDGEPLKFGSVMFQNVAGGQPSRAQIQPDGRFVLSTFSPEDGAVVGSYRVRVMCYSSQDPAVGPTAGDSLGNLLIPERYTSFGASGLSYEIKEGDNSPIDIELTKQPQRR
ncbi:hypothetical protein Pla111_00550 [Botrimarina hoheduenensis]|uniref:Carboxypeptidase regulatory-like domain-containing protein n=1 Tax=Botrimarina hoheduenensis TaxID=2528000 RepID=A0A5C5WDS9_9BACT|nr:hypothetical protein Pla111_00550 [Botrimarina hoheduenensis]